MRLIDADALFKDICDSINEMTKIGLMVDGEWFWAKLNYALENAPTIEPERKRGRWTKAYDGNDGHVKCTECFKTYDWISQAQYYNYCPNCGSCNGGDPE